MGEILHNFGNIRQLDIIVGVAHDTDLDKALAAIRETLQTNPRVLKEPEPIVTTNKVSSSSIEISIRPWVKVADYIYAKGEVTKAVIESFRTRDIVIPYSQHEIRILENSRDNKLD